MSRWDDLWEAKSLPLRRRLWGSQWTKTGVGLLFFVGCLLCVALVLRGYLPARRRAGAPTPAATAPQTPFQAAFAQAQRSYFDAQRTAKRQLESLEEWDPDNIRGSTPEILRRSLIARTQEIGLAQAAAREAADRAETDEERYRAVWLLVHIEHDLGHYRKELEQARKLVELQPRKPEARLLLERAAAENEPANPERRARSRPATRGF